MQEYSFAFIAMKVVSPFTVAVIENCFHLCNSVEAEES